MLCPVAEAMPEGIQPLAYPKLVGQVEEMELKYASLAKQTNINSKVDKLVKKVEEQVRVMTEQHSCHCEPIHQKHREEMRQLKTLCDNQKQAVEALEAADTCHMAQQQ